MKGGMCVLVHKFPRPCSQSEDFLLLAICQEKLWMAPLLGVFKATLDRALSTWSGGSCLCLWYGVLELDDL